MLTTAIGVLVKPDIELGLPQSAMNYELTRKVHEQGLTAAPDTGAFVVKFYRSSDLRPLKHALKDARDAVERYTQPWDKAWSLLYNVDFDRFTSAIQEASEKLAQASAEFKKRYAEILEENETRLGKCFDPKFYPDESRVLDFPKIKIEYRNITEDDKRVTSMEELGRIKGEVEDKLKEKGKDVDEEKEKVGMSLEEYLAQETARREQEAALRASKKKRGKAGVMETQSAFTFLEEAASTLEAIPEATQEQLPELPAGAIMANDDLAELDHLACYA